VNATGVDGVKGEGTVLDQTRIRFLSGMQSSMHSQVVGVPKSLVANITLIRPLRRVGHSMDAKLVQLPECLAALLAHVRLLVRVGHLVDAQIVGLREAPAADVANVIFSSSQATPSRWSSLGLTYVFYLLWCFCGVSLLESLGGSNI